MNRSRSWSEFGSSRRNHRSQWSPHNLGGCRSSFLLLDFGWVQLGFSRGGEPADAKATRAIAKGLIPALIRADGGLLDLHQELHIRLGALHLL